MSYFKQSFAAGLVIALGGYIFISLQGGFAGAVLFSIGLIIVCLYGLNLYTGKICYFFDNRAKFPALWYALILSGNILASVITGVIASYIASDKNKEYVQLIVADKLNKPYLSIVLSAVFCNIFIFLAVNTWQQHQNAIGMLVIILSVAGFILTESEHCIADCFYFTAAGASIIRCIPFMVFCILGNTIGGLFARKIFEI